MPEQFVKINDKIKLWYETSGNPEDPPVLLIAGAGSSGISLFSETLRNRLNKNYYVIRFDHLDTGLSTYFDFDKDPYSLLDMTQDVISLLKTLKINKIHIIGSSMGGYIAELLAISFPEYLSSLTILCSTTDFSPAINAVQGNSVETILPPPDPQVTEMLRSTLYASKEACIGQQLSYEELSEEDTKKYEAILQKIEQHSKNPMADQNHLKAILKIANSPYSNINKNLAQVNIPTTVIHGKEDPLFPLVHGQSIAKAIPNAKLHIIKNMGHMILPIFFEEIIEIILEHLN